MGSPSGANGPVSMEQLLRGIDTYDEELTVYTPEGEDVVPETRVVLVDEEAGDPPADTVYLLEVELIKDVLRVWREWRGGAEPTIPQACEAVVHYAKHDAFQPVR